MSNYHVLEGNFTGNRYSVIFHIPIPDVNNLVSYSYRTAIKDNENLVDGVKTSAVKSISAAEQTQLDNGAIFEHSETFRTHHSESKAATKTKLDARYSALTSKVLSNLQNKYKFYSYEVNV